MPMSYTTSSDETNPWPDIPAIRQAGNLVVLDDPAVQIALVTMASGAKFVGLRIDLPGGKTGVLRLRREEFLGAAQMLLHDRS